MRSSRRKIVRRSFLAVVTGTSALALGACSDPGDQAGGNENAGNAAQPAGGSQDQAQDQDRG